MRSLISLLYPKMKMAFVHWLSQLGLLSFSRVLCVSVSGFPPSPTVLSPLFCALLASQVYNSIDSAYVRPKVCSHGKLQDLSEIPSQKVWKRWKKTPPLHSWANWCALGCVYIKLQPLLLALNECCTQVQGNSWGLQQIAFFQSMTITEFS